MDHAQRCGIGILYSIDTDMDLKIIWVGRFQATDSADRLDGVVVSVFATAPRVKGSHPAEAMYF
jgi:hypothetical protein